MVLLRSGLLGAVLLLLFTAPGPVAAPVTFRVALPVPLPADLEAPEEPLRPLTLALADSLVAFDSSTGWAKPGLAESWTDVDGVTWHFTLRAARWSDGSPLTAQDVADGWSRSGRLPSLPALDNAVVRVTVSDPLHLTVTLRRPAASPAVFGTPALAVYPAASSSKSSGPFVLGTRGPGAEVTVVKNPLWREASTVKLDRLVFRFAGSADEASRLYREGEADWVPLGYGPGTSFDPGRKDQVTAPGWGALFLRLNVAQGPLADPALRRALAGALDQASLVRELRGPLLVPNPGLVPRPAAGSAARTTPKLQGPFYRPGTRLTILYAVGETNGRIAGRIAEQWERLLGFVVETKEASFAQVLRDRESGAYHVALGGWLGDYADPLAFLEIFRSGARQDTGFDDAMFDTLVGLAARTPLGRSRDRLASEAEARLLQEAPVIPLLSFASANQINLKRWTGWSTNPTDIHPWPGIAPRK